MRTAPKEKIQNQSGDAGDFSTKQSAINEYPITQETVEMVNKEGYKATAYTVDMSNK